MYCGEHNGRETGGEQEEDGRKTEGEREGDGRETGGHEGNGREEIRYTSIREHTTAFYINKAAAQKLRAG